VENALRVVEFLKNHPKVAAVDPPPLPKHPRPQTKTAQKRGGPFLYALRVSMPTG